ncbi:MAG: hypothetical protein OXI60_02105 [Acidiferrobacterales bacterium]|nr:hypothetical protein [Acidiferrobacterales bacterium]
MVYFTHIKPSLSRVGTLTVKLTEYSIQTIEGIIICQILIAIGTATDSEIIGMTGKFLLVLLFTSIFVRAHKAINYFHYEVIKKRLFNNSIDNFSYFILYLIAFATWPYTAKAFGFLVEFSEAIGIHIGFFIDEVAGTHPFEAEISP